MTRMQPNRQVVGILAVLVVVLIPPVDAATLVGITANDADTVSLVGGTWDSGSGRWYACRSAGHGPSGR